MLDSNEPREPSKTRKRFNEVLVPSSFSKFGMTVGWSSTLGQQAPKCGCITQGWPSWAFGAHARGWQVVLLVIKGDFWAKSVRDAFPAARILVYESGLDLKSFAIKINVWFSDIDPPVC